MLWDERKPSHAALMPAESVMASVGRCGIRGSSLPAFGVSGERLKSRHRYCIIKQSEFEEAGGLAVGVKRRASISGLTVGSRQIPFCPLEKSSGIGEMPEGFRAYIS